MSNVVRFLVGIRFAVLCYLFSMHTAHAANRQLCLSKLAIEDARTNCPAAGTPGARATCANGIVTDTAPTGFLIYLYDRDGSDIANDDYIAAFSWNGSSMQQCFTFAWEGTAAASDGEPEPDVYPVLYPYMSANTDVAYTVEDTNGDGTAETALANRVIFREDRFENCTAGAACTITKTLKGPSAGTDSGASYQALLTLRSGFATFGPYITQPIKVWIPGDTCAGCGGNSSRQLMQGTAALGRDGAVMHELGHIVHETMFNMDVVYDDWSWGPGVWAFDSFEWQMGATTEGWATYIFFVGWYDPATATAPMWYTFDGEQPVGLKANCSDNRAVPGQVAKFFWDMDDAHNEPSATPAPGLPQSADSSNKTTAAIIQGWQTFADGTGNQQRREGGLGCTTNIQGQPSPQGYCDSNGINVWDYVNNAFPTDAAMSLNIRHNCLWDQDPN